MSFTDYFLLINRHNLSVLVKSIRLVKNPMNAILFILGKQERITVYRKSSTNVPLAVEEWGLFSLLLSKHVSDVSSNEDNRIEFKWDNQFIKLYRGSESFFADFTGVFGVEDYGEMKSEGMTIIDVGANIGDSAIYFYLKGASKIISVEPLKSNYDVLLKNIELNGLGQLVHAIRAGCGLDGFANIDDTASLDAGFSINPPKEVTNSSKIPVISLKTLVFEYTKPDEKISLKMDCEGCEYNTILREEDSILRRFSEIVLEYHQGHKDIKNRLKSLGFKVRKRRSFTVGDLNHRSKNRGILYATRR